MNLSIWRGIAWAGALLATMGLAPLEGVDLEVGPELAAITTEELAAVQAQVPVLLVDARGPEVYAQGHLPGAGNFNTDYGMGSVRVLRRVSSSTTTECVNVSGAAVCHNAVRRS